MPSQMIVKAISNGWIYSQAGEIADESIQPASLDLRLGEVAYRLRCSFLPDKKPVEAKLERYAMGEVDLRDGGGILEQNRPYLVPLVECLALPKGVRAKANPKSSTGRLDIFTRVITDRSYRFDEVPEGYHGGLYLEIVPRTFTIKVAPGLALNQLRLMVGDGSLSDTELRRLHQQMPLLFRNGRPLEPEKVAVGGGLFLGLHLGQARGGSLVGFRAKENSELIDLSKIDYYSMSAFWEQVYNEEGARIVLHPEKFYLLMSRDGVRIPPEYAAEMTAYDPTSGELRTHYAGFFDPGFGWPSGPGQANGSRAALEVRAHDVPFAVEHGQNICKLSFERMIDVPDRLYGQRLASNYQGQEIALSKHFQREHRRASDQLDLFEER
jgi:dCTP deaminase